MNLKRCLSRLAIDAWQIVGALSLVACGGGSTDVPEAGAAQTSVASPGNLAASATAGNSTQTTDQQLASAIESSAINTQTTDASTAGSESAAPAVASSARSEIASPRTALSTAATPGGSDAIAGTGGTGYFVDSVNGNDSWSGKAATAATGNVGPWKTLAKLATISFFPAPANSAARCAPLPCG